jgi:ferredoxin
MCDAGEARPHRVSVVGQAEAFDAPAGQPLLLSARGAGLVLPSSCRNGTCRECMCRLVEGRVSYAIEWPGLSADEKREGFILPCVARPESDLVIDAPRATRSAA